MTARADMMTNDEDIDRNRLSDDGHASTSKQTESHRDETLM